MCRNNPWRGINGAAADLVEPEPTARKQRMMQELAKQVAS
jgi:hypothetical protein